MDSSEHEINLQALQKAKKVRLLDSKELQLLTELSTLSKRLHFAVRLSVSKTNFDQFEILNG